jgi:hypothetical protein
MSEVRRGRARTDTGFEPVSDLLVLAAIERAERHEQVEGVQWGHIPMHLGLVPKAATTVKLRPQVDALIADGLVMQSRRGGCKVWGLTAAGRARLVAARRAGETLSLPEAPQHREWRQARAKAAGEIEWLREQLQGALEQALSSLSGPQADAAIWLDRGEHVRTRCAQLSVAYYCLHQWPEPDDSQPDAKALLGWSYSLVRGTVESTQADATVLSGRLQVVRGATGKQARVAPARFSSDGRHRPRD